MDVAGRYRLLEVIGRGGHAVVWRAWDTVLGVLRAVKTIEAPVEYRPVLRHRLKTEALAMARLAHPNVLAVYDVGQDAGQDYLVMDLAEGGSLADRLAEGGPIPAHLAACCAVQVLSALGAAHRLGIVHRDLKPQNVLRDRHGVALLADFGVALLPDPEALRNTGTGVFLGSIAYMAPEQRLDPRRVGPTADIYGVATTLYAILTDANPVDLFTASLDSPRWAGIPPALTVILQRATALEPSNRYADATELARAIASILPDLPGREATPDAVARAADVALALLFEDGSSPGMTPPEPEPLPPGAWRTATVLEAPAPPRGVSAYTMPIEEPARARGFRWIPWTVGFGVVVLAAAGGLLLWPIAFPVRPPETPAPEAGAPPSTPTLATVAAPSEVDPPVTPALPPVASGTSAGGPPAPAARGQGAASPPTRAAEEAPDAVASTEEVEGPTQPVPAVTVVVSEPGAAMGGGSSTWSGSFGGRPATLRLTGSPDRLTGTLEVRFLDRIQTSRVHGRLDPKNGALILEDEDRSRPDAGAYTAHLASDRSRLTGTFHTFAGGRVTGFSMSILP
jgi:eukaryotic-like serine/threonine-protein kinase